MKEYAVVPILLFPTAVQNSITRSPGFLVWKVSVSVIIFVIGDLPALLNCPA